MSGGLQAEVGVGKCETDQEGREKQLEKKQNAKAGFLFLDARKADE